MTFFITAKHLLLQYFLSKNSNDDDDDDNIIKNLTYRWNLFKNTNLSGIQVRLKLLYNNYLIMKYL